MTLNMEECRIVRMSVALDWRGLGIGKAILFHLLDLAKARGLQTAHVETNHDWYPALSLYLGCGFRHLYSDEVSAHMAFDLGA